MTAPAVTASVKQTSRETSPGSDARPRRPGRWIAIVALSLLLHVTLLDLLPHWSLAPNDDEPNDAPLNVTLMPPIQPVATPAVEVAPTPPRPAPVARPRTRPPKPIAPTFVPESTDEVPQVQLTTPGSAAPQPATPAAPPIAVAPEPTQPSPEPAAPPPVATPRVTATVPQSARLSYRVLRLDAKNAEPTRYYGVGTIDWSIDGDRYRSELQASLQILFVKVGLLALHSEGTIGTGGLMPDRYTETPRKRATVATSFNRDARQSITFSASQVSAPLVAGAQDRLSILFQIGGLLLANPRQADVGSRIDVAVAGVRGDVSNWTFASQGVEALDTGAGSLSTTHLHRAPQPGIDDRTIDVWIAQDAGGYPAKVLYTEANGSTTEMMLDRIGALPKTDGADPPAP